MDNGILLVAALIPSIALGCFIYSKDKMGREPVSLLIKLFLGGIGSIVLTLIISTILGFIFPAFMNDTYTNEWEMFIGVVFGVGLVEEFSKWTYLNLISWKNKEFDHIFDAIVYAVFVTLGFATLENILYVFQYGSIGTAIIRAVVSVPGHVFDAIIMGAFYGEAKQAQLNNNKNGVRINLLLSIIMPMMAHGLFDYLIFLNTSATTIIFYIYVAILYIVCFITVNKVSKNRLNFLDKVCPNCGGVTDGFFCTSCGMRIK